MRIEVKIPIDCPSRELSFVEKWVYTCSLIGHPEIVCDSDETDTFPFPDGCPLNRDGIVQIVKIK